VIVLFRAVVLDSVHKRNGVQDEMIVQVVFFVKVGRHNHLIAVAPKTGSELHSDFVGHFGGGLSGSERLIAVVGHRPVFLAKPLFHGKHFITGG